MIVGTSHTSDSNIDLFDVCFPIQHNKRKRLEHFQKFQFFHGEGKSNS